MRYLFSETEFQILLAVAGVEDVLMFPIGRMPDGRQLAEAVADLYLQERIEEKNGILAVTPGLQAAVDGIKHAKVVLRLSYGRKEERHRLVYAADRKTLTFLEQERTPAGNQVRVWNSDADSLVQELAESETLSGLPNRNREQAAELEDAAREFPAGEETSIFTAECFRNDSAEPIRTVSVREDLLCQWLVAEENGKEILRHVYSEEELMERLLEQLEEAK